MHLFAKLMVFSLLVCFAVFSLRSRLEVCSPFGPPFVEEPFEVCSPFCPWFPSAQWLESRLLCLRSPFSGLVCAGRAVTSLFFFFFAQRFCALGSCVCWGAWYFCLSGLEDICLPFRSCIFPRERLESIRLRS